ncbi:MAG: TetR/AcrR family transcriptional regulator [Cellulosilyticaceae bacterium]
MRISEGGTHFTTRNQPCRMCIAQTLIDLMKVKKLENITVTELVKKAHVSRMTFYKYYTSKEEVLSDYLYEMVNEYIADTREHVDDIGEVHDIKRICHCLNFFKAYSPFLLTLVAARQYSIIIEAINNYMDIYVIPTSRYAPYEVYYYAGALSNVFIKWLESGMEESPERIAEMIYRHWV